LEDFAGRFGPGKRDRVVHPLRLSTCGHQTGIAKEGKMSRDLRLRLIEHLDEEADADLAAEHQVEQTEASPIRERLEQDFEVFGRFFHVRLDKLMCRTHPSHIFTNLNMRRT